VFPQNGEEPFGIDGLCEVVVHAGLVGAADILLKGVARHCDHRHSRGVRPVKRAELAKGDHKALIKATLPGGAYSAEPCMMRCAMCKKLCIDEKYM